MEVCGARDVIGWLDRREMSPLPDIAVKLELGERRVLDWGRWKITAALLKNDGEERLRSGAMSARLPADAPCRLSVSNASKTNSEFMRGITWWSAPSTPIISWAHENRSIRWMPGAFADVHNGGNCDIIIHVFCLEEQTEKRGSVS
jgi:hypothetical protein